MTTLRTPAILSAIGLALLVGCAHSMPLSANAAPRLSPPETQPLPPVWAGNDVEDSIHPVYFQSDSANLTADSRVALDADIAALKRWPDARVLLKGRTDSSGDYTYNLNLGAHRAASVRAYMVANGVDLSRVLVTSEGENEASEGDTAIEHAMDRRVDVIVLWNAEESVAMSDEMWEL